MSYIRDFLLLAVVILLTFTQTATAQTTSPPDQFGGVTTFQGDNLGTIDQGKYRILNNRFGNPLAGQVVWRYAQQNFWDWGSWFEKTGFGSINAPAIVLGWHWWESKTNTGLPTRIWDNAPVMAQAEWSLTPTNNFRKLNVGYHMWFHDPDQLEGVLDWRDNPRAKISVWLHHEGDILPDGTWQDNVFYQGYEWEIWRGKSSAGWDVFTFRRYNGAPSIPNTELRLRDFIHEIVYFRGWMGNERFLTGVEFGPEVDYAINTVFQVTSNFHINVEEEEVEPQPQQESEPTGDTMYVSGRHLFSPTGEKVVLRGVNAGIAWLPVNLSLIHI